jgi:hypothetical protein
MALLNKTEESNTSSDKAKRHVTHFINVGIVTNSGSVIKLEAVPVYDGGTKNQRTLIEALNSGKYKAEELAIRIDVRENVKSTDVGSSDDWATVTVVEVEPTAA